MQKRIILVASLLGAASLLHLSSVQPVEVASSEISIVTIDSNYLPPNEKVTYERPTAPISEMIPLDEELQEYLYETCEEYNVDYNLALAVMWQESEFNPKLISRTNDYGLMQINVCNHKWLSNILNIVDFLDPKQNIEAGIYMLSMLKEKYEDEHKVLMAYNYGEGGAKACWISGIVTSRYSLQVHQRKDIIYDILKDI